MHRSLQGPVSAVTRWCNKALASPWALLAALAFVVLYIALGPRLGLREPVIDLAFLITVSTFILVFLIEHQGNRDRAAMQVKLDELLRAVKDADERKIGIEDRDPSEVDLIRDQTRERSRRLVG